MIASVLVIAASILGCISKRNLTPLEENAQIWSLAAATTSLRTATSNRSAEDRHQHKQRTDRQKRPPGERWGRPHVRRKALIRPAPGIRGAEKVVHQKVPPASEAEPGDYDEDLCAHLMCPLVQNRFP